MHVHELDWFDARSLLAIGRACTARVRAVRDPARFRFPLELDLLTPDLSGVLREPPPAHPPIVVYAAEVEGGGGGNASRVLSPEQLAKAAGRPWPPPRSAADLQRDELMTKVHAVLEDAAARRQDKRRRARKADAAAAAVDQEDEESEDPDEEEDEEGEDRLLLGAKGEDEDPLPLGGWAVEEP